ncbi:MAG: lipopolysaccharide biosynthesis protein [Bacteroidota bacterium]
MTIARTISSLFALVVAMVLTRLLSEEVYGIYRKVWLIYGISAPVFISSLVNTLYYQRSTDALRNSSVVWGALSLALGYGLLVGGIIALGSPWLADFVQAPIQEALRYFALYAGLSVIAGTAEPIFVLAHRKKWLMVYNLGYNLFEALIITGSFWMGYPLEQVVMIMAIGPAVRILVILAGIVKYSFSWPGWAAIWREIPESVRYGGGLMLTAIVGIAVVDIDNWIISRAYESNVIYAIYAIGARKLPFVSAFTNSVSSGLVMEYGPALKQGKFERMMAAIRTQTDRVWLLLIPGMMVGWVFAEELLVFVFEKSTYAQSAPIFRIYLMLIIANMVFPHSVLLGRGKSYVQARFSMLELVGNLVFSVLLVQWIGFAGPAYASLVGAFGYTGLQMWYCHRHYHIRWIRFFPSLAVVGKILLFVGIGWGFMYIKGLWFWPSFLGMSLFALVFMLVSMKQHLQRHPSKG